MNRTTIDLAHRRNLVPAQDPLTTFERAFCSLSESDRRCIRLLILSGKVDVTIDVNSGDATLIPTTEAQPFLDAVFAHTG